MCKTNRKKKKKRNWRNQLSECANKITTLFLKLLCITNIRPWQTKKVTSVNCNKLLIDAFWESSRSGNSKEAGNKTHFPAPLPANSLFHDVRRASLIIEKGVMILVDIGCPIKKHAITNNRPTYRFFVGILWLNYLR